MTQRTQMDADFFSFSQSTAQLNSLNLSFLRHLRSNVGTALYFLSFQI